MGEGEDTLPGARWAPLGDALGRVLGITPCLRLTRGVSVKITVAPSWIMRHK